MDSEGFIAVLDFGSQYTQNIVRRIRECRVKAKIFRGTASLEDIAGAVGIVGSGGPRSVYEDGAPQLHPSILRSELSYLGICYGHQAAAYESGHIVEPGNQREYGLAEIDSIPDDALFKNMCSRNVWMSHGDHVKMREIGAKSLEILARSANGMVAAVRFVTGGGAPGYGLQFHPEVDHTEDGRKIFNNFLRICNAPENWTSEWMIRDAMAYIAERVGNRDVVAFVSGGVDSTVAATLLDKATKEHGLGGKRYYLHIDSGLQRTNEARTVIEALKSAGLERVVLIDAEQRFLASLKGVVDPQRKRNIIGNLFVDVGQEYVDAYGGDWRKTLLCQGTLYPDIVESGYGVDAAKKAVVRSSAAEIKRHHNVGVRKIREKQEKSLIVEPNRELFKDEVREVGEELGLPRDILYRHPFPGPGLAIRVLGEVTYERLQMLRKADDILLEEIRREGLYDKIWQAFVVLLPIRSVGVMGDDGTYHYMASIRCVASKDAMTAVSFDMPHDVRQRIMTRIVNEVRGINRVMYDDTSKPPGTIEFE